MMTLPFSEVSKSRKHNCKQNKKKELIRLEHASKIHVVLKKIAAVCIEEVFDHTMMID